MLFSNTYLAARRRVNWLGPCQQTDELPFWRFKSYFRSLRVTKNTAVADNMTLHVITSAKEAIFTHTDCSRGGGVLTDVCLSVCLSA